LSQRQWRFLIAILGITLAKQNCRAAILGRQRKETAAKIAALQFLTIDEV
jgi:hypothetical protein